MIHGKKISFNSADAAYLRKKHYCPNCNAKMKRTKFTRVVNSNSPEASQYNFKIIKNRVLTLGRRPDPLTLYGNVEFIIKGLECPNCGLQLTSQEMRQYEGEGGGFSAFVNKLGRILIAAVLIILIPAIILAMLYNAHKVGVLPQNVWDVIQSILPNFVMDFLENNVKM